MNGAYLHLFSLSSAQLQIDQSLVKRYYIMLKQLFLRFKGGPK